MGVVKYDHGNAYASRIDLRVNFIFKASSISQHNQYEGDHLSSLVLSSLLKLNIGDVVDVFINTGTLSKGTDGVYNSFSAILLSY